MKVIRFFLYSFLLIFSDACIDKYDLPTIVGEPVLVVDGLITDQPGPYTVELYKAIPQETLASERTMVKGATVKIIDDAGTTEILTEVEAGIYMTSLIQGVQGRKYHIDINIGDNEYISEPQELRPAGQIDSIYYRFQENAINENDLSLPQDVLDVYMDSHGDEGKSNLFRWRWSSIYEVLTYPQLRTKWQGRPPVEVPDPLQCSGYITRNGGITQIDDCICCSCWVPEFNGMPLVSNNQSSSTVEFKGSFVARVPVDHWRFTKKFYMRVEQMSVSEEVYEFWKLAKAQYDGEGSLFQPNAVRVTGNIHSVNNSEEKVLGVFAVSGVVSKEFSVGRRQVPDNIEIALDTIRGSCLGPFRNSSNQRPSFW